MDNGNALVTRALALVGCLVLTRRQLSHQLNYNAALEGFPEKCKFASFCPGRPLFLKPRLPTETASSRQMTTLQLGLPTPWYDPCMSGNEEPPVRPHGTVSISGTRSSHRRWVLCSLGEPLRMTAPRSPGGWFGPASRSSSSSVPSNRSRGYSDPKGRKAGRVLCQFDSPKTANGLQVGCGRMHHSIRHGCLAAFGWGAI